MNSNLKKLSASALLAFAMAALPVLSHAHSISSLTEQSLSSGPFVRGSLTGTIASGDAINLQITGTLGTFTIDTGTLSELAPGIFVFTGGTLIVRNSQGIFRDSLTTGTLLSTGTGSFTIGAGLEPHAGLISGSTSFNFGITNGLITRGTAGVNFVGSLTPIPEPTTLGLFGTGLVGLVGVARRKLKI
jgi:hypothetical protein